MKDIFNTTTIIDEWIVECKNNCCKTRRFADDISHDDTGAVVIAHNGAEEAAELWNRRAEINEEPAP